MNSHYKCFSSHLEGFTCGGVYRGAMLENGDLELLNQDKEVVTMPSEYFAEV